MKRLLTYAILIVSILGCSKDNDDIIPDLSFRAEINLDNAIYNQSNPFILKPGGLNSRVGVNGVVIFKVSSYECYAFDLMCTNDEHETPGYYFTEMTEEGSIIMECPECGSQFNIAVEYGAVIEGPAKWPLKRYQTSISGSTLSIWN